MNQMIPPRLGCPRILSCIQALYQSGEIDNEMKNHLITATKKSLHSGYAELDELLRLLRYSISMNEIMDELLTITSSR